MLSYGGARARELLTEAYAGTTRGGGRASEDCLVDLWLADSGRFGWVDLSAGPFQWGPVVGGEGVRTASSLPDTHDLLAASPAVVGEGVEDGGGGEHLAAGAADMGGRLSSGTGPPSLEMLLSEEAVVKQVSARAPRACERRALRCKPHTASELPHIDSALPHTNSARHASCTRA
jgi:hypothetical protein